MRGGDPDHPDRRPEETRRNPYASAQEHEIVWRVSSRRSKTGPDPGTNHRVGELFS
jgi:hypothetical protein